MKDMIYLGEKQFKRLNQDGSEITITFTDNTRLWIEITEYADNSMLEVVLFDENDEIIETIHEGYNRS